MKAGLRKIKVSSLFSKKNNRMFFSERITESVQIVLNDIRSGRNTRIDLDQFYESFDVYQHLQKRKNILRTQLVQLDEDTKQYQDIAAKIDEIFNDERTMRVNILELALFLEKLEDNSINGALRQNFKVGNIIAMQSILPDTLLERRQAEILRNDTAVEQIAKKLVDNSNEFLVKAQLTNLDYRRRDRFSKTLFYFDKGLISAQVSGYSLQIGNYAYTYAHFLHLYGRYDQSLQLYHEALDAFVSSQKGLHVEISVVYNSLGAIYRSLLDYNTAEKHYKQALQMYAGLITSDGYDYRADQANVFNNLGILYTDWKRFREAQHAFDEAIDIQEDLVSKYPRLYLPDLALTLNNIGNLRAENDDFSGALKAFKQTLSIRRRLAKKDPVIFLPLIAMALNNLGVLYMDHQDLKKAEQALLEMIRIYHALGENDPELYLSSEAMGCYNLGNIYYTNNLFELARAEFTKALEIYTGIAVKDKQTFLNIALTKNCLGMTLTDLFQFEEAEKQHLDGINILKSVINGAPKSFLADLAMSLTNLGDLYRIQKKRDALGCYLEASDIWDKLARLYPKSYRGDKATTLSNLGLYYYEQKNSQASFDSFRKALKIRRKMMKLAPDAYSADFAETANNFGLLCLEQNLVKEAGKLFLAAAGIYTGLIQSNGKAFLPDLAMILNNLGITQFRSGNPKMAMSNYESSYAIYQRLQKKDAKTYLPDTVMVSVNMAEVLQQYYIDKKHSLSFVRQALAGINTMLPVMVLEDSFALSWNIMLKWDLDPMEFIRNTLGEESDLPNLATQCNLKFDTIN